MNFDLSLVSLDQVDVWVNLQILRLDELYPYFHIKCFIKNKTKHKQSYPGNHSNMAVVLWAYVRLSIVSHWRKLMRVGYLFQSFVCSCQNISSPIWQVCLHTRMQSYVDICRHINSYSNELIKVDRMGDGARYLWICNYWEGRFDWFWSFDINFVWLARV